jgi:uncharacterized membrane protein
VSGFGVKMASDQPISQTDLEARLVRIEQAIGWLIEQERRRSANEALVGQPVPTPNTSLAAPPPSTPADHRVASPPPHAPAGGSEDRSHAVPTPPSRPALALSSTTLIAAVGGTIFLAGAAFLLHYSMQQGWIGNELRFVGALAAGLGLTLFAARLILGNGRRIGVAVLFAGLGTLQLAFRVGGIDYQFFPPNLGLAGACVATLFAGGLAARGPSGGAMAIALLSGLLAPLVFSQGGHHEIELALYLAFLLGSALLVPYLSGEGGGWKFARWLGLVGTWILLLFAVIEVRGESERLLMLGLLALHHLLAMFWIWLFGQARLKPATPTTMWMLVSLAAPSLAWELWDELDWAAELFSVVMIAYAALHLALVSLARRKLQTRAADIGIMALAGGHLALAVPVALDWQWVGPAWGIFALGIAIAATRQQADATNEERRPLTILAFGFATIASIHFLVPLHWYQHSWNESGDPLTQWLPFINPRFAQALFAGASWFFLLRLPVLRLFGFLALEVVATLALSTEIASMIFFASESQRAYAITSTLVFALVGAGQWIASMRLKKGALERALAGAGYAWLAVAALKLIFVDLADATTPLRAVVFLGVGAIFLAAALLGHRLRGEEQ